MWKKTSMIYIASLQYTLVNVPWMKKLMKAGKVTGIQDIAIAGEFFCK